MPPLALANPAPLADPAQLMNPQSHGVQHHALEAVDGWARATEC